MLRIAIACGALAVAGLETNAIAGVTQGTLLTQSRADKRIVDLPLRHTEVQIHIAGWVADVRVAQRFSNPYSDKIEAVYAFPLPAGAAVDRVMLRSGDQLIRGSLRRRAEAKAVYRQAKALGKVASLLEEEGAGVFTQSIANIEPKAEVEVELHYVETLAREGRRYALVFPMVVSPRPTDGSAEKAPRFLAPNERSAHDIDLSVDLEAGLPIGDFGSPTHAVEVSRPTPSSARLSLGKSDRIPNKDFVLHYTVGGKEPEVAMIAHRGAAEEKSGADGTFLLLIEPPWSEDQAPVPPREIVLAIDVSSSMAGAPLERARAAAKNTLAKLRPGDTFQIATFADHPTLLATRPIAAKPRNIELAERYLDSLAAEGGTDMISAMKAVLGAPPDPDRLRIVVLVSDGYVGDERPILETVAAHLGPSRIFAIGVGSVVNRYLLEEMAALGRGEVATDEAPIDHPVMTDIAVDWGELKVRGLVPKRIPDLFMGRPIALTGRYGQGGSGRIVVSGTAGGRKVELPLWIELPEGGVEHAAVPVLWARGRIRELIRSAYVDAADASEQITAIALENGLLCPYTAFVAVSDRITRPGIARTVPVPVEIPADLSLGQMAFGYGGHGGYASYAGGSGYAYGYRALGAASHGGGSGFSMWHAEAAPAQIEGVLDKSAITRVLDPHRAAIKHCYEKRLPARPDLQGRVVVRISISGDGRVTEARIVSSTLGDEKVERCITTRLGGVEFPALSGGGTVEVNIPYVFTAGDRRTE